MSHVIFRVKNEMDPEPKMPVLLGFVKKRKVGHD